MNNISHLKIIEILTAFSLLFSKYFLAKETLLGWVLACVGYVLITYFDFKKKLPVMAVSAMSLILLTIYGYLKWGGYALAGITIFDWVVISVTTIVAIYVSYRQIQTRNTLWKYELIGTWLGSAAYVLLAMNSFMGWVCLAVMHIAFGYVFSIKKAWFLVGLNVVSLGIAVATIFSIF